MMTYSPLAVGLLAGKLRRGQEPPAGSHGAQRQQEFAKAKTEQIGRIVEVLIDVAAEHGKMPAQVAIAWILDHPEVTAAISGPDLPEHIEEVCAAVGWKLSEPSRQRQAELSRPRGSETYL